MRVALKTREVEVPSLGRKDGQRGDRDADRDAGLNLKVEEGRRLDREGAGRADRERRSPRPASPDATRAQRSKVWVSAGPRSMVVPALSAANRSAPRSCGSSRKDWRWPRSRRSDPPTTRREPSWRRSRRRRQAAAQVSLLVNRGERGARYRDAGSDRRQRRAAPPICCARAGSAPPWSATTRIPASPAGIVLRQNPQAGFQIAPGEPISLEVSR